MIYIPPLTHWDSGWMAVSLATGKALAEFHRDSKLVHRCDPAKVKLEPVSEYLARLNYENRLDKAANRR